MPKIALIKEFIMYYKTSRLLATKEKTIQLFPKSDIQQERQQFNHAENVIYYCGDR